VSSVGVNASYSLLATRYSLRRTGEGGLAGWRSRNGERLANVTAMIETILASKPFDIARFAVAQGTLADLVVI